MNQATPNTLSPQAAAEQAHAQFGHAMKNALNESADALPEATLDKLRTARRAALAVRKQAVSVREKQTAWGFASGWIATSLGHIASPALFAVPMIAVGMGLVSFSDNNAENYTQTVAEIDTQVLIQDVPLDALLDKGFVHYVQVGE